MKNKRILANISLAVSTFALAFIALPAASAGTMKLVIGDGSSVTISPTGVESYTGSCVGGSCAGTVTILPGQLTWTGSIGTFTGTVTGTSGQATTEAQLDLLTSGLTTGATSDTITISWTDVGFTIGVTPANMNVVGGGLGTQSFSSYVDNGNAPFGTGTLVNTIAGGSASGPGPSSSPFSMTDVAVLTLPAGVGTNFPPDSLDFLFNDAPAPLAVNCTGLAAGLVGTPYTGSVVASGGIPPYAYSVTAGSLTPLGLNISTGAITGTPTVAGTLNFTAQVVDSSGAAAINTATSACSILVTTPNNTPPTPIGSNDTATIGFWHNKNGQAVILALNGGPTSTKLGNWLASSFPYLYGAHSSNNMAGKSNTTVAALFLTFFGAGGQKTSAQILAGALASYVTSSTLTGSTKSVGFGFNNSPGGTGAKGINVGSSGTAIGLSNNTVYSVLQLLNQVNVDVQNGTYSAAANAFNVIFSNINQTGDIS